MPSVPTVDMSANDDWQVAFQKINSNFRTISNCISAIGVVPEFTDSQQTAINDAVSGIVMNMAYPVGSIIGTSTTSDNRLLYGTWVQIFKDRYVMGAGEDIASGEQGGRSSFTIAANNLPDHEHTLRVGADTGTNLTDTVIIGHSPASGTVSTQTTTANPTAITINPEYEAAYWFKRTA